MAIDYNVSASRPATPRMLVRYAGLRSSDGTRLAVAAARGCVIWTTTWAEQMRGLFYYNWKETHSGRIFFNRRCGKVWSTQKFRGFKGYHRCNEGYGHGWSIDVTRCITERRYDLRGRPISEWDFFKVHVIFKGFPIWRSHKMHVNAYANGKIYYH